VAERQLPKLNVAGSIPVSRSISPQLPPSSERRHVLMSIGLSKFSDPRSDLRHDLSVFASGCYRRQRHGSSTPSWRLRAAPSTRVNAKRILQMDGIAVAFVAPLNSLLSRRID
jgi:hypothetical protein